MKLIGVIVESYLNLFKEQIFKFSDEFDIDFDFYKRQLKIRKKETYNPNFYSQLIYNITPIVGINGSGKSSLVSMINGNLDANNISCCLIFIGGGKIFLKHSKSFEPIEQIECFGCYLERHDYFEGANIKFISTQSKILNLTNIVKSYQFLKANHIITSSLKLGVKNHYSQKYSDNNMLFDYKMLTPNHEINKEIFFDNLFKFCLDKSLKDIFSTIFDVNIEYEYIDPIESDEDRKRCIAELIKTFFDSLNLQNLNVKNVDEYVTIFNSIEGILRQGIELKLPDDSILKNKYCLESLPMGKFTSDIDLKPLKKHADFFISFYQIKDLFIVNEERIIFVLENIFEEFKIFISNYSMIHNSLVEIEGLTTSDRELFMSTGEQNILKLFSELTDIMGNKDRLTTFGDILNQLDTLLKKDQKNAKRDAESQHYIIVVDEIEVGMHLEWSRKLINYIISWIEGQRQDNNAVFPTFQFIFTTHSPFMLSDIREGNIIFLEKNNTTQKSTVRSHPNTFAKNIQEIMHDNMFIKNIYGEFAISKINKMISDLQLNEREGESLRHYLNKEQLLSDIDMISEPLLRNKLYDMYDRKFKESTIDSRIEQLRLEIEQLEQEKQRLRE